MLVRQQGPRVVDVQSDTNIVLMRSYSVLDAEVRAGWLRDMVERAIIADRAEQAAGEAERTAQAEMERDVAWVRAIDSQCGGADVDDGIACATAEALGVTERVALRLLDGSPTTDEHIAAAIRAARGAR